MNTRYFVPLLHIFADLRTLHEKYMRIGKEGCFQSSYKAKGRLVAGLTVKHKPIREYWMNTEICLHIQTDISTTSLFNDMKMEQHRKIF